MTLPRVDDFDTLRERIRLQGVLTNLTALHIGSGRITQMEVIDMPVLKNAQGYPFIPGASLKGVIRSTLEATLRTAGLPQLWACDPISNGACGAEDERSGPVPEHCAVCRIFGSHLVGSHVRFSDAPLLDPNGSPPLEMRDGVSIDRDLRVASNKRKFDFEVVSPGASFRLEVFAQNLAPWQLGLVLASFDQLNDGFTALGGFTSRGLGRVQIQWKEITRTTASQLLSGEGPKELPIEDTFNGWRKALGQQLEGSN